MAIKETPGAKLNGGAGSESHISKALHSPSTSKSPMSGVEEKRPRRHSDAAGGENHIENTAPSKACGRVGDKRRNGEHRRNQAQAQGLLASGPLQEHGLLPSSRACRVPVGADDSLWYGLGTPGATAETAGLLRLPPCTEAGWEGCSQAVVFASRQQETLS